MSVGSRELEETPPAQGPALEMWLLGRLSPARVSQGTHPKPEVTGSGIALPMGPAHGTEQSRAGQRGVGGWERTSKGSELAGTGEVAAAWRPRGGKVASGCLSRRPVCVHVRSCLRKETAFILPEGAAFSTSKDFA